MSIEEKYLGKNYRINNNTFFKTTGDKSSWFCVVNDVKNTFSYNLKLAEHIVNNWCISQHIDPKDIIKNIDFIGVINAEKKEFIFPIKHFEYRTINLQEEYIELGFKRQMLRTRLPEHELNLILSSNEQDEEFLTFVGELPFQLHSGRNGKFGLTVINIKNGSKYVSENTSLASFSTSIDSCYDENSEYTDTNIKFNLILKPDLFKVEY